MYVALLTLWEGNDYHPFVYLVENDRDQLIDQLQEHLLVKDLQKYRQHGKKEYYTLLSVDPRSSWFLCGHHRSFPREAVS